MMKLIAKSSYTFIEARIKNRFDKIKRFFANTTSKAERHQKIIKEWLECEKCRTTLKDEVDFLPFEIINFYLLNYLE